MRKKSAAIGRWLWAVIEKPVAMIVASLVLIIGNWFIKLTEALFS